MKMAEWGQKNCDKEMLNPQIEFTSPDSTITREFNVNDIKLEALTLADLPDVSIIKELNVDCPHSTQFMLYNGSYLKHDWRMNLRDMARESEPTRHGSSEVCSDAPDARYAAARFTVPWTHVTREGCIVRDACSNSFATGSPVVLNQTLFHMLYEVNGVYVYYLHNLTSWTSPCSGWSRWSKSSGSCAAETDLDASTKSALVDAFGTSADSNPNLVDINFANMPAMCKTKQGRAALTGATVTVDGTCFHNIHPDEWSVYDFTELSQRSKETAIARSQKMRNPLTQPAEQGSFKVSRAVDTSMRILSSSKHRLGRVGDTVEFSELPPRLQSAEMAQLVGASLEGSSVKEVACDSPGEVANDPELGARYAMSLGKFTDDNAGLQRSYKASEHSMVWTNVVLRAQDQLRQRCAWALSQIFVLNHGRTEARLAYYDIFVRLAFGNFRDVLKEVSYNPLMGQYLTFINQKAYKADGKFPDENYAREVMQLFTIGLWRLNMDGTPQLDSHGNPIPTYTSNHIMEFSRAWTGFSFNAMRRNLESPNENHDWNEIDSMRLHKPEYRDPFPKMDLNDGYLGDGFPLCSSLPQRSFLIQGAEYRFVGSSGPPDTLPLTSAQSELAAHLCHLTQSGGASTQCQLTPAVTLNSTLTCHAQECLVDEIRFVRVAIGNETAYFEYLPPPCIQLTFYVDAKRIREHQSTDEFLCADPHTAVAGTACRDDCSSDNYWAQQQCSYFGERVQFETAMGRCSKANMSLCPWHEAASGKGSMECGYDRVFTWMDQPCKVRVQVRPTGLVSIVHQPTTDVHFMADTANTFRVRWQENTYPQVETGCAAGCEVRHESCLCDTIAVITAPFDGTSAATKEEMDEVLRIGSLPPNAYGNGVYRRCMSEQCLSMGAEVWLKGNRFDENAIFKLERNGTHSWLRNQLAVVEVGGVFKFRNPPHFVPFIRELASELDLVHETDAMIDHLHTFQNTPPFIAKLLIQRFGTSNPSPRYVQVVSDAFASGSYAEGGDFSGKYGCLGATFAAILLDREARDSALDHDPTAGQMREPLLVVLHFLRAMEYASRDTREVELTGMTDKIGMQAFESETVFNFYLPDYQPRGPIADASLYSPESQLRNTPDTISFLNGMVSLVRQGLSGCTGSFGNVPDRGCKSARETADGWLNYAPEGGNRELVEVDGTPTYLECELLIADLDMLLTWGRLSPTNEATVLDACMRPRAGTSALQRVQELLVATAEFSVTNRNHLSWHVQPPRPIVVSLNRPYKALILLYFGGGMDTFNVLVPHTCAPYDLYAEYFTVRGGLAADGGVALDKDSLLPIKSTAGSQPCTQFGVHPALQLVKDLYDAGDASFIANVGALVESLDKFSFKHKRRPPFLFAHNKMTHEAHSVESGALFSKGVVGRLVDALSSQASPYKVGSYSLAGNQQILEGGFVPTVVNPRWGVTGLNAKELEAAYSNMSKMRSTSYFAHTYNGVLQKSLEDSKTLADKLSRASLNQTFETWGLSSAFAQIAKLVDVRSELKSERDIFYVSVGGWDHHSEVIESMQGKLEYVNAALSTFVAEMKAKGIWNQVTIATSSEFGRTLTTNGRGTDHGWGGNHMLLGGGLNGQQVFGEFPPSLAMDESNPLTMKRGRVIPTTPWEGMWQALAQWMGVEDAKMDSVLPNKNNFDPARLFTSDQLWFPTPPAPPAPPPTPMSPPTMPVPPDLPPSPSPPPSAPDPPPELPFPSPPPPAHPLPPLPPSPPYPPSPPPPPPSPSPAMPPLDALRELPRKAAAMSSTYRGRSKLAADKCIDENLKSMCHTECDTSDPWLEVELEHFYQVDYVMLRNRKGLEARLGHYEVWLGNTSGERDVRCLSATVPESSRDARLITNRCNAAGRFVTLLLPGEKRCLNLYDLRLFTIHAQSDTRAIMPASFAIQLDGVEAPDVDVEALLDVEAPEESEMGLGIANDLWNLTWLEASAGALLLAVWTALLCCCLRRRRSQDLRDSLDMDKLSVRSIGNGRISMQTEHVAPNPPQQPPQFSESTRDAALESPALEDSHPYQDHGLTPRREGGSMRQQMQQIGQLFRQRTVDEIPLKANAEHI